MPFNTQTASAVATDIAIGDSVTNLLAGSILFGGVAGVLAQDNSNLFFDDTNNRLGVGINSSILARLHAKGSGATAATLSAIFTNSAGTVGLKVLDDTSVWFGDYFNLIDTTPSSAGLGALELKTGTTKLFYLTKDNAKSVGFNNNISTGGASMVWGGRYSANTASGENATAFGEACQATEVNTTAHGSRAFAKIANQYSHAANINNGLNNGYSRFVYAFDSGTTKAAGVATVIATIDFANLTNSSEGSIFSLNIKNTVITRTTAAPIAAYDAQTQTDILTIVYKSNIISILSATVNVLTNGNAAMLTGGFTYSVSGKVLSITYTTPTGYAGNARFSGSNVIDATMGGF